MVQSIINMYVHKFYNTIYLCTCHLSYKVITQAAVYLKTDHCMLHTEITYGCISAMIEVEQVYIMQKLNSVAFHTHTYI